MSDTIAIVGSAMRADAEALRIISQNVANAEVTAYRRQIPLVHSEFGQVQDVLEAAQASMRNAVEQPARLAFDPRAGTLKSTGEPLHLALEGGGYFALQSEHGVLLSRRGDFHVSAQGVLTSASGNPVLGTNGPIQLGSATPSVDADGTLRVGSEVVDQLQVVQVGAEAELQYLGDGLYQQPTQLAARSDGYAMVRQGFLETSNVQPVAEMVQMMETLRHFEASQRLIVGYDQMLDKAIGTLGRVE